MKEVIVEKLVRTTEIIKMSDEEAAIYEEQVKTDTDKRSWSNIVKEAMHFNDVSVSDVKIFIRDIPKKEKKSRNKKEK